MCHTPFTKKRKRNMMMERKRDEKYSPETLNFISLSLETVPSMLLRVQVFGYAVAAHEQSSLTEVTN